MEFVCPLEEERYTFRVCCDGAQQVKLVIDFHPGASQIFALHEVKKGVWELPLKLPPGEYRFCYHLYDGRSLTYLTPPGWETDGLKAVLHVQGGGRPIRQPQSEMARRNHPRLANDRRSFLRGASASR